MTHSKDCLYHLEQSFLDCTCGASNAPLTPSDEMVEAASSVLEQSGVCLNIRLTRAALQAALNLMGGKK
jgi:hypothetical protein